jgi:hypothetical protein
MKKAFSFVISVVCAVASLQAVAAKQEQTGVSQTSTPLSALQSEDVTTSGRNWTAQDGKDLIPPLTLDRQGVETWGAATQPGPRNQHATPPHGKPLAEGDRSNVPGRE